MKLLIKKCLNKKPLIAETFSTFSLSFLKLKLRPNYTDSNRKKYNKSISYLNIFLMMVKAGSSFALFKGTLLLRIITFPFCLESVA